MATNYKNKYKQGNNKVGTRGKISFKYVPNDAKAPLDTKFNVLKEDGTYEYVFKPELMDSIEKLEQYRDIVKGKLIAWDTETTGLTYFEDYIVGFSLSTNENNGMYAPIRHEIKQIVKTEIPLVDENGNQLFTKAGKARTKKIDKINYYEEESNLDPKKSLDILYDILINASTVICHNAEFDMIMLQAEGYDVSKIKFLDTMTLLYLNDAEATSLLKLKEAEKHYLGRYRSNFKDTLGKEEDFRYIKPIDAYFYAAADSAATFGIFKKLYPKVTKLLDDNDDIIKIGDKKYNILNSDNKLVKYWIDYYAHTKLYIDKEVAVEFSKKIEQDIIKLKEEIYTYFNNGVFNLSTASKEFKEAMKNKFVNTGAKTDKGAISFGKEGIKVYNKNLNDLKGLNLKNVTFINSAVEFDTRESYMLGNIIKEHGQEYFIISSFNDCIKVTNKEHKALSRPEFIKILNVMYRSERKKLKILKKIQENSSLNKALNSYVEKLTKVDYCRMRYRLFGTKSGRLSSGNGSKSDKKVKNRYYIDLNAQNLTKPKSAMYKAYRSEEEGNILGWCFKQVSDEYASLNRDKEYIVEGAAPELNIRNAIIAPPETYVLSCDYSSQEYLFLAIMSQDSLMLQNFRDGIDPHTATAMAVWGKENYTKEHRKRAKGLNFALNYGGNEYTVHKNLEIPLDDAKEMVDKYNERFYECIQWKKKQVNKMYKNGGVVTTLFGRPRKLGSYIKMSESYESTDERASESIRNGAERRVASHDIQGSCGDLCRYVLCKLYEKIFRIPEKEKDCKFLSTVHDEVNTLVTKDKIIQYAREMQDIMTFTIPNSDLPISVTIGIGNRYGSCFDFKFTDDTRTELVPKRA